MEAIHYDMIWDDYLAIDAMNPSTLKQGRRSMLRLSHAIEGMHQPAKSTTEVGSVVHAMIAGEFSDRYALVPRFELDEENVTTTGKSTNSRATLYYKEKVAEWQSNLSEKEVITEVVFNTASKIAERVRTECGKFIDGSAHEVTLTGRLANTFCKTRLDGLKFVEQGSGNVCVWDLKVTSDATDQGFYRTVKRLGYLFSAAMHKELLRVNGMALVEYKFIVAENGEDYDVRIIDVPLAVLEPHEDRVYRLLEDYETCKTTGIWPGMGHAPLAVPEWDMPEKEIEWSL